MKKLILNSLMLVAALTFFGTKTASAQSHNVLFTTNHGDFKVMLYDFTPNHRDMFLEAVRKGEYDQALFNRIIEHFVVQGGEHDMDIAKREAADPTGLKPRLAPEFHERAFHKIGAMGAGRDDNPEKASFFNQLYFVVGKQPITEAELDALERRKSMKFVSAQRAEYLKNGGLPRLDQDYVIFGEVVEGLEVLMRISRLAKDAQDFPLEPVRFSVKLMQE